MMTKRRLLLVSGLVAMVAIIGYLALWVSAPRHRINGNSIQLVKAGMTKAEVEAIFGVPPGDYSGRQIHERFSPQSIKGEQSAVWVGERFVVYTSFDSSGRAQEFMFTANSKDETLFSRIRRWLRL